MCDVLIDNLSKGMETLEEGFFYAVDHSKKKAIDAFEVSAKAVHHSYTWCGRNIENLAHKILPETAAKIVASTVWALPYTALSVALPSVLADITTSLSIGLWQAAGKEFDETVGKEHRQHLFTGIRNASVIRVGIDTVAMAATGNWFLLLPIIANIFFALQSHAIGQQDTPKESILPASEV